MSTGDELKDKILLYRQVGWNLQIQDYTDESLKNIIKTVDKAKNDLIKSLKKADKIKVDYLDNLLQASKEQLAQNILDASNIAGVASLSEYNSILSFEGRVPAFIPASLSAAQLEALIIEVPVGGKLLNEWVTDTFDKDIIQELKTIVGAGMLKGEGIEKIIKSLSASFNLLKKDAKALTRTYIADINNRAAKAVYDANSDIIKSEKWSATLEVSTISGNGTCARCIGLDSRSYKLGEPHIRPPIHISCRCYMIPRTVSYKELGLNIPELERIARPYSERGQSREIVAAGIIQKDGEDFLRSRSKLYQINTLGKNRYEMLKDGRVKWEDLVDKDGNLRLLKKDKDGNYIGVQ